MNDDNELHFRMPENYLWAGNIFAGLLGLLELIFLYVTFLQHHTEFTRAILYRVLLFLPILIGFTLSLFSTTEVTVNFQKRIYRIVQRWLWWTRVRHGSLDDFKAVYVTEQGYVFLVGKDPTWQTFSPIRQSVPLGNGGFGKCGVAFVDEVVRRCGLDVVTKLPR